MVRGIIFISTKKECFISATKKIPFKKFMYRFKKVTTGMINNSINGKYLKLYVLTTEKIKC